MQPALVPGTTTDSLLVDALRWRYAVRRFSDEALPEADVRTLMDTVAQSPSSYGLQPYRVLLVRSRSVQRRLLAHSFGQDKVLHCSHLVVFASQTDPGEALVDGYVERVLAQRGGDPEALRGFATHVEQALAAQTPAQRLAWLHAQTHLALGTLLTSAALLGIDSCPIGGFEPEGYDDVLDLRAAGLTASVVCALGRRHPQDASAHLPKVRIPADQLVRRVSA